VNPHAPSYFGRVDGVSHLALQIIVMGEDDRGKHRKDEGGDSSHSHSHSRHKHRDKEDRDRHHRKKRRRHDHEDDNRHHSNKQEDAKNRHRGDQNPPPEKSLADEFEEDMWEEKPPEASTVTPKSARQSWMTESKGDDKSDPFSSLLGAPVKEKKPVEKPRPVEPGMSAREINTALRQAPPSSSDEEDGDDEDKYTPPIYTIGDAGSAWRMMKLKNIYTAAKESMRPVEEVALERMGSLQAFDEAREEEAELERRKRDRRNEGVTKVKVTGELYQQRLQKEQKRQKRQEELYPPPKPSLLTEMMTEKPRITQSDLNKLQAALLRAEMSNAPNAKKLAEDYAAAVEQFNNQDAITEVVALPASHSALLPHISREQSKSETEMTIEDMVKEERALKRMATVDRIAKDRRFKDDLDYLDENAERLAAPTKRKEINLKAQSIQDYKKQQKIMENCPLCYKDDGRMPLAPVISLGTRVYLSLPTEPELTSDGAMIVPIRHAKNLAECDDDEWEEIRVRSPSSFLAVLIDCRISKSV